MNDHHAPRWKPLIAARGEDLFAGYAAFYKVDQTAKCARPSMAADWTQTRSK